MVGGLSGCAGFRETGCREAIRGRVRETQTHSPRDAGFAGARRRSVAGDRVWVGRVGHGCGDGGGKQAGRLVCREICRQHAGGCEQPSGNRGRSGHWVGCRIRSGRTSATLAADGSIRIGSSWGTAPVDGCFDGGGSCWPGVGWKAGCQIRGAGRAERSCTGSRPPASAGRSPGRGAWRVGRVFGDGGRGNVRRAGGRGASRTRCCHHQPCSQHPGRFPGCAGAGPGIAPDARASDRISAGEPARRFVSQGKAGAGCVGCRRGRFDRSPNRIHPDCDRAGQPVPEHFRLPSNFLEPAALHGSGAGAEGSRNQGSVCRRRVWCRCGSREPARIRSPTLPDSASSPSRHRIHHSPNGRTGGCRASCRSSCRAFAAGSSCLHFTTGGPG